MSEETSFEGTPLELSTAAGVEQLVRAHGTLFLVTNMNGDISPRGARELGLFSRDTRFLSFWTLRVADAELVHLSSDRNHDAFNQIDLMIAGGDDGEFLDDPQNYVHIRRRQLLDDNFGEELMITSYLDRPVTIRLELAFAVDFADIFEVRGAKRKARGQQLAAEIDPAGITFAYEGRDGGRYASELSFTPPPDELRSDAAHYKLRVEPGQSARLQVALSHRSEGVKPTAQKTSFANRSEQLLHHADSYRQRCTHVRCSNGMVQQVLDRSVADLACLRLDLAGGQIVAAGIPWFCVPFGRDSLITSYAAMLLDPSLGKESLRVLASYQGTRHDPVTEEEPGKIFHELRFGEMARAKETPHTPYYGTIDATPLFVVVADAVFRMTADHAWLTELAPAIEAALGWIDTRSANGTGLVSYARKSAGGLDNQGWKDSKAAVVMPDGRRAVPPIALCEIQGYCADAYLKGSGLLAALGKRELAERYASRARSLRELIEERFWLADRNRYAYAVDGNDETFDTVVSNLGHLLWSNVASPERALATAELLLDTRSFSGFGVRTLAAGQGAYNPLSYHNGTVWPHDNALIVKGMSQYGLQEQASVVFDGLISAMAHFRDRRLPELFCGLSREDGNLVRYPVACSPQAWAAATPFLLLQSVLGIHVDAPERRLAIRNPQLPAALEWVELDNLRVGQSRVQLRLRRVQNHVHVEKLDISGPQLRTEITH
ncbi:MAG TPA: glycogen debranching N-terminal domain-containing protein [Polyangiales bacterium]|nr:glycogen debranching N-terminal domain-containing protein [Polyangiales bacterium]